jgi:hypothetical protein
VRNITKRIYLVLMILITTPAMSDSGIWSGIFDINGHGAYDFTGLISDNQATAYTKKAKVVYSGTINKEKKILEWNLLMFLKNGSYFGEANIKAKIINNNIMSGSWVTSPAKDYGNIYLVKLDEKEVLNVGEIINKTWETVNSKTKHTLKIKDNKILGKDENNCNYYGSINGISKKIYNVNIEIASCGISDGIYKGMAHVSSKNNINKLTITATNKNFSLFLNLN